MKKIRRLALAILIVGLTLSLKAQNSTSTEHSASLVGPAKTEVNPFAEFALSDEQMAKLQALTQELSPKMQAVFTNQTLGVAERQQKINAIQAERAKGLKDILTPEQWAQYENRQKPLRDKTMPPKVQMPHDQTNNVVPAFANGRFFSSVTASNAFLAQTNETLTNMVKESGPLRKQMLTNSAMIANGTSSYSGFSQTAKEFHQNGIPTDGTQSLKPGPRQTNGSSSGVAQRWHVNSEASPQTNSPLGSKTDNSSPKQIQFP